MTSSLSVLYAYAAYGAAFFVYCLNGSVTGYCRGDRPSMLSDMALMVILPTVLVAAVALVRIRWVNGLLPL